MKRKTKLILALIAIVVAIASIGTLAYLTETTDKVTNTFKQTLLPMEVTDSGYDEYYDTKEHTGSVTVTTPEAAAIAEIKYSETEGGPYTLTQPPKYKDVGNYKVYYSVNALGYIPVEDSFDVIIRPLEVTVTARNKTIKFGDPPSHNGVTYAGFIGDEDESVLTGTLVYTFPTYKAGDPEGLYEDEIVPSGLSAKNYIVKHIPGDLKVRASTGMSYAYVDPDGVFTIYTMEPGETYGNAATEWSYNDDDTWSIILKKPGSYPFYFLESPSDTFDAVMIGGGGGGASAVGTSDKGGNGGNGGDMRSTPGFDTASFLGAANKTDAVVGVGGKGGEMSGLLCTQIHLSVSGKYFSQSCKSQYGLIRTGADGGDTVFGGKTAKGGLGGLSDASTQPAQAAPTDLGATESYTTGQTGAKAQYNTTAGTTGYTYLGIVSGSSGAAGTSNSWADEYDLPSFPRAPGGTNAGSSGICGTRGNIEGHTGTDATAYGNGGGGGSKTAALHSNLSYGRVPGFCYVDTGSNGLTHYCGGGGNGSQGIIYLSGTLGDDVYEAPELADEEDTTGLEFYFTSSVNAYSTYGSTESVKHNGIDTTGYEGATYHVFVNEYNPLFYTPDLTVRYTDDDTWVMTIMNSGTFEFVGSANTSGKLDIQLIGGGQSGGGNSYYRWYEAGYGYEGWFTSYSNGVLGNGGHVTTETDKLIEAGSYEITIGTGGVNNTYYDSTTGTPPRYNGTATSAFGFTAAGGDNTAQEEIVCFDGVTRCHKGFHDHDIGQRKLANGAANTGDAGASCYKDDVSNHGGVPGNGGSGVVLVRSSTPITNSLVINP